MKHPPWSSSKTVSTLLCAVTYAQMGCGLSARAQGISPGPEVSNVPHVVPGTAPATASSTALPAATGAVTAKADSPSSGAFFAALNNAMPEGWVPSAIERQTALIPLKAAQSESTTSTPPLTNVDPQTAEILSEFALSCIYRRAYQRGQRFLYVTAYEFKNPCGAFGAYNFLREGASTVITRGDGSSEDDHSISFWKGNYFIKLVQTSEDDEESKEALRSIADRIAKSIPQNAAVPPILSQLPALDRVKGTEKLVMGPTAGRKFFPAPYIGFLSLDRAQGAAIADYQFLRPYPERLKLLYVDYGDPVVASSVYDAYVGNLNVHHALNDVGESDLPTTLLKIDGGYLLCQLRGSKVAIIIGARKRLSPLILARQIR
ncbi:MAG TPA: DUF6599 family protein [Candidatus Obscuribacterales bacterium]